MEWKKDTGDAEKEMLGSLVLTREGDRDRGSEYGAGGCFKMLSCKTTRKIRSEGIQRSTSSAGWQDSWVWVAWCLIMHASFGVCTGAAISHIPDHGFCSHTLQLQRTPTGISSVCHMALMWQDPSKAVLQKLELRKV